MAPKYRDPAEFIANVYCTHRPLGDRRYKVRCELSIGYD